MIPRPLFLALLLACAKPGPVAPVARADTVWMGVTHVETFDGKVIVKFEEVKRTKREVMP